MTHIATAHPYFGAFVLFLLTVIAFPATLTLQRYISRKLARLDTEKLKMAIYECGPELDRQPNRISVQFYFNCLTFILLK